jgi:hypothetical protein
MALFEIPAGVVSDGALRAAASCIGGPFLLVFPSPP